MWLTKKTNNHQKLIKRVGYQKDQSGIINRYYRERGAWDSHLNNCKEYILNSIKDKSNNTIAILGSGWLLDVPIKELINICDTIHLYDICHPREIKQKYKKYKNVHFIEKDIIEPIIANLVEISDSNNLIQNFINLNPQTNISFEEYDYVVSLNLLNQLDIIPIDYLSKKTNANNEEWLAIRKHIQQLHFNSLPKNKSSLITDYIEIQLNHNNHKIKEKELVHISLPQKNSKEWIWKFDETKNYYSDRNVHFKVLAIEI